MGALTDVTVVLLMRRRIVWNSEKVPSANAKLFFHAKVVKFEFSAQKSALLFLLVLISTLQIKYLFMKKTAGISGNYLRKPDINLYPIENTCIEMDPSFICHK